MSEKPWWWPEITDAEWIARIRSDYPEDTEDLDDDTIREEYADGRKYAVTWDHIGDAYGDWERLADAFLALLSEREKGGDDGE